LLNRWSVLNSTVLRWSRDFFSEVSQIGLGLNKISERISVSLNTAYATDQSVSVSGTLSFSLDRTNTEHDLRFHSDQRSQTGTVLVRVYLDSNHSGSREADEALIKDAVVSLSEMKKFTSDRNGELYIPGLSPNTPVEFALLPESLSDPMLKPVQDRFQVIPKLGKISEIEVGVAWYGEVEGQVFKSTEIGNRPVSRERVFIELSDHSVREVKTDREGYYLFEKLPPGEAKLSLAQSTEPNVILIKIASEGGSFSHQNFLIHLPLK
jgi:hypothetical protein